MANMRAVAARVQKGETVQFRPTGNSMTGRVESGQLVTVAPLAEDTELRKNMVVLVKVKGNVYLHLIKAIRSGQYQIGNNKGGINGWVSRNAIYGTMLPSSKG